MRLAGVDDGLELEGGQLALVDDVLREGEVIPDVRGSHTGQGGRLHHWVRVLPAQLHCTGAERGGRGSVCERGILAKCYVSEWHGNYGRRKMRTKSGDLHLSHIPKSSLHQNNRLCKSGEQMDSNNNEG